MRRFPGCAAALAVLLASSVLPVPARSVPDPAGATAAVLSFVDAAAGGVEVVRHWPGAASDTMVYPFVPYFWDGCPGPGAIMMLITAPRGLPPDVGEIAKALAAYAPGSADARAALARVVESLRTPGDQAFEALKAAAPWMSDLSSYERWGYAVFMFIYWEGLRCVVSVRAIPEGYGIPFVR